MFLHNIPLLHIVGYKVFFFILSVLIFTRLYLVYHAPNTVDALHRAVMIQTLAGTTEPQNNPLKVIETCHAIVAFAMAAGFFTIVIRGKKIL